MAKTGKPRSGSMQFWPRKRAKRPQPRIRTFTKIDKAKPVGFAGYKVGMTHILFTDNRKHSMTKGESLRWPVTIIEVPPLQVIGAKFYKKTYGGATNASTQVMYDKLDKNLARKLTPKKSKEEKKLSDLKPEGYDEIRILFATQPSLTSLGKKKPEIFEMGIGGSLTEQYEYVKENLGKTISVKSVVEEGNLIDTHAITKGKGFQGPVKRFGIALRESKSEKTRRGPGSLGGWKGHAHFMYRIAHAGKMGFHQRVEYNKLLLKIGEDPKEINVPGGYVRYGELKNDYLLVKGGVAGPAKRLIIFKEAIRPNKKLGMETPSIEHISVSSHQG